MIHINDTRFNDSTKKIILDHGITSAEQLAEIFRQDPDRTAEVLGLRQFEIGDKLPEIAFAETAPPKFSLGARIDHVPAPKLAFALVPFSITLPPKVDLRAQMPPIRNQQNRGTCVAFATLAVLEHKLLAAEDMSEQFQYCMCKQADGDPGPGTYLAYSFPSLTTNGCCREATWPYVPNDDPGNEGQGPAPASAVAEAASFIQPSTRQLPPTSVQAIKVELAAGRCVAFSIPVFDSWYLNQAVIDTGDLIMPLSSEPVVGGHAMCFVGYEDSTEPGNPGGGRFLLRNSWGTGWGAQGYGTIPYSYIAQYGKEAFTIV